MIKYLIYDTETTGLNIIKDRPFLHAYGLADEKLNLVSKHLFDASNQAERKVFEQWLIKVPTIVGANIKFDIHMAVNDGFDESIFATKNFIDIAVLARLVIDHDTQSDKTFSTALKKLAVRYLGVDSANEERILKMELSQLVSAHKLAMRQYLIDQNVWPANLTRTEDTTLLNQIYSSWNKIFHLYPAIKKPRETFLFQHPAPTYADCSNVRTYGLTDIVLTHGLFRLWYPKVVQLQQTETLKRISAAVFPLYLTERKGLSVDLLQMLRDRNTLLSEYTKNKIVDPRTGAVLSTGQHAKLKELYEYESGDYIESVDKNVREEIEDRSPAARMASYLSKMDKFLNTYITGILNKLVVVNGEYKIFTQYNLAGTVTGRLSSDFQQFPKEPLVLSDGSEINIRSWFIVPKGDKYMFYFDYSQMELRLQCEWTNIVNGAPDINMIRAFSPYKCQHYVTLDEFSGIDADALRPGHPDEPLEDCLKKGWSVWIDPLTQQYWQPIDLHGLTAKHAFPGIDESHPDWKKYRKLGKSTNFAVNYGAAAPKIQQALKVDFATAKALVSGYKQAFAGVVDFGKWISKRVYVTDNIPNLMLRRYYSRNKHQLQNWLVQGSGADILLLKTRELYEYIKNRPHWNFLISVHDEIGLTCKDIPLPQLIQEVADIRALMCHKMSAVDVVSDVEYTTTKWSEKDDWKGTV